MVAHPDDETLWAGGTLLMHPEWQRSIFTLCRGGDADRAPKFRQALERLGAVGDMADLEDTPEQAPLAGALVRETVAALLGETSYDMLLTHSPDGEYTRHRRHGEVFAAVADLWRAG
jgi:LmbE family N-acetylglucosaminyl deacetylase